MSPVEPVEYVFRIDVFTPETLPLKRLAEYLAALAKMFGHPEHTHFAGLAHGSALLRSRVDAVDAPKVATRLDTIRLGTAPKDALAAKEELENLLANDNAAGELTDALSGAVVLPFVGRDRPKPILFPPFREDTTIDGQLVNIGGKDTTAHATLQDGDVYHTGIVMNRSMARDLAPLLYGPQLRFYGSGRFQRLANGEWKMIEFGVAKFEVLQGKTAAEALADLRGIPDNGLMLPDAYHSIDAEHDLHGGNDE